MATLLHGDCLDLLAVYQATPARCPFDVVLTDPPGAKNMAKWDTERGGRDMWVAWLAARLAATLSCSRPGAWLCCWAHPSTTGWTQRAIEDAGWIIFDRVIHLNAQGRAATSTRLAPGCEDWWLAYAPGTPSPLRLDDLPTVATTWRRRHPRNVVMDGEVAAALDVAAGSRKSGSILAIF